MQATATPSSAAKWIIFIAITIGTFMITLDTSAVLVALPLVSREFGVPVALLQWVVLAYMLVITSFTPIAGRLSDLLGRSRMFMFGFMVFLTGSLLSTFAWNLPTLALFRICTAVGAAFLMGNSHAILAGVFHSGERGRVFGANGSVVALGHISGPVIGGMLVAWLGWRSIFYVTPLIAVAGFLMARAYLPRELANGKKERMDVPGALLFVSGASALLFGLGGAAANPLLSLRVGGVGSLGLALLLVFAWWQTRSASPIMPPIIFRTPGVAAGYLAGFTQFMANYTSTFLTPFIAVNALGFDARTAGLVMAAPPLTSVFISPLSGYLSDRFGPRLFTLAGLTFLATGLFLLSGASPSWGPLDVMWRLAFLGLGQGLFGSPNNSTIMSAVPQSVTGVTGGLFASIRNFAFSVSAALAAATFTFGSKAGTTTAAYLDGYQLATRVAMAIALCGLIPAMVRAVPARTEEKEGTAHA